MGGWSLLRHAAHPPNKQNYVDVGSKVFHKFLRTVRVPRCMSLGSRSTWRAWVWIHLKTISYRGSVIGGSTTAAAGEGVEIQSIFKSEYERSEFNLSPERSHGTDPTSPSIRGDGGVLGGGHDSCMYVDKSWPQKVCYRSSHEHLRDQ